MQPCDLDLFTEADLAVGLALLASKPNARAVAARVAAIPADERHFYRWAFEVVIAVSAVSPEIASRVRRHYGRTPEARDQIQLQQEQFREWREAITDMPAGMEYRVQDAVIDTRPDAPPNRVPAFVQVGLPEPGVNYISLFTEDELTAALSFRSPENAARKVAAAVFAIPAAEQAHYVWMHGTLMLLGLVSEEIAERVRTHFGHSPEQREELARQQRSFCAELAARPLATGVFTVDSVVHDRRLDQSR